MQTSTLTDAVRGFEEIDRGGLGGRTIRRGKGKQIKTRKLQ